MKELVLTLLLVAATSASWTSVTNPFKSMWLSLYSAADPSSSTATPAAPDDECRGCAQNRVQAELDQDPILTELRVEYVKQQILRKLRLEKPPEVSLSISTLPKPLVNGHVLELKPGEPLEPQIPAESFYGKTNQIVVFPDESIPYSKKCRQSSNHITGFNPAACFTFFLPNEMQFVSVTSAELWFYKEEDKNDSFNQTFVLSELDHWDQRGSFEKNTIMAIFETTIGEAAGARQGAAPAQRDRAVLLAHATVAHSAALRRLEQHHHAKDPAQHGRRGLRLHVSAFAVRLSARGAAGMFPANEEGEAQRSRKKPERHKTTTSRRRQSNLSSEICLCAAQRDDEFRILCRQKGKRARRRRNFTEKTGAILRPERARTGE
ncbi:uncharacterized protein LOC131666386 isoform X2 [Phymastichus coffea]|uniref:uncharacterized protein LOC131666386 isoform X2 n=1 Tax=Phymastichus coffea TaxID=108790 RepID=UPI00273BF598|nr:uncharacterized protein LOC131666386 isoform X2 [Phymastichus coffea]